MKKVLTLLFLTVFLGIIQPVCGMSQSIGVAAQGKSVPKRVALRLHESNYEKTAAAVNAFIEVSIPFAMERRIRKEDSVQMKELLQRAIWKENQLLEKIDLPSSVEVVDVYPGDEDAVIKRAIAEKWCVRTPANWIKIIKEENRKDSFKTYYVKADGNDSADGLSPENAWKSLSKVNSADLGYGDKVLFRCGDIFRGNLEPMSGRVGAPIFYGSFGKGRKPIIEPSYDASSASCWTPVDSATSAITRLWKCVMVSDEELGNIILNHGKKGCAYKEDKLEQLQGRDLHFTWVRAENAVYMVSDINPGLRFSSIELAEKKHVIYEEACHDVCYDGLWLRYGCAHGIGGSDVKRISIKNCDVCWIGGSTLYFDNFGKSVRYGNGIEFWCGAEDVLVEGCRIWECYDTGITSQSNVAGVLQKNLIYRGNRIWNCEYLIEYWQQGEGSVTENILIENNVCLDAGKGWGHSRRWNPNAAHLMFFDNTAATENFVIRGNLFKNTENCGIRLFNAWYPKIKMENNRWVIRKNLLCRYHGRPTSNLIYKYPDHLDAVNKDDEEEIQSQTIEQPMVFGPGRKELKRFQQRFGFK